jgi:FKBP-type peptidyl-prolyl cis-trans isomerase
MRFGALIIPTILASCGGAGPNHNFSEKTALGVEYAVITEGGGAKPTKGQVIEFYSEQRRADGELVLQSRGRQVYKLTDPVTYGDLADMLGNLAEGDSAVFRLDAERIYLRGRPSLMDGQDHLYLYVGVRNVMPEEEFVRMQNEMLRKEMAADIDSINAYLNREGITGYTMTDYGMFYKVESEGEGPVAVTGQLIKMEYDGYLSDNTKFEAREDGGNIQFNAGRGQLIRAFDEAALMFKAGTHVKLWVPAKLAYGHDGRINQVASDQWVWFDVHFDDPGVLMREQQKEIEAYLRSRNIQATKDSAGFYYVITQPGSGPYPPPSSRVTVHYTGKLMNGKVFDTSRNPPGDPRTFALNQVISGWTLGIQKFNAGAKGTLYIPSALGYGEAGAGANIPPNSILIFDIEMISFQ